MVDRAGDQAERWTRADADSDLAFRRPLEQHRQLDILDPACQGAVGRLGIDLRIARGNRLERLRPALGDRQDGAAEVKVLRESPVVEEAERRAIDAFGPLESLKRRKVGADLEADVERLRAEVVPEQVADQHLRAGGCGDEHRGHGRSGTPTQCSHRARPVRDRSDTRDSTGSTCVG